MSDQYDSDDDCYIIEDESDEDDNNFEVVLLKSGIASPDGSSYPSESSLPISVLSRPEVSRISSDTLSIVQSDQRCPRQLLNYNEKCEKLIFCALNELCVLRGKFKERLSDLRNRMHSVIQQPAPDKKRPLLFTQPYFFDVRQFYPPPNQETIERKLQKCFDANFTVPRSWTLKESENLINVTRNNAVEISLKPLKLKYEHLKSKLEGTEYLSEEDELNCAEEMEQIEDKIEAIRNDDPNIHLEKNGDKLDWLHISSVDLGGFRSADECEIMYRYYLHQNINKGCFTPEEDAQLKEIALAHCERNWDAIAEELGTNRTGIQCHQRYVRRLDEGFMKKAWTPDDDEALVRTVENIKVGEYVPWKKVSFLLPEWNHLQALNRWERNLKPQNKDGNWKPEEDAVLCLGVPAIGRRWTKFSPLFYGRTSYLCRERYVNVLDPLLLTGSWTIADDTKLLMKIVKYGERWGKISTHFPQRTDNMVNQRALKIKMAKPSIYEKILNCTTEDEVKTILPKQQLVSSKQCTVLNDRRKNIRDAAFMSAQNALEQVLGHQINISEFSTFDDYASVINYSNLKKIADILISKEDVVLTRPINMYYDKHSIKKEYSDTEADMILLHDDRKSDNEESSDESDDLGSDVDFSDGFSDIIKTEEDKEVISSAIQSSLRELLLPLAVHGPVSDKRFYVKDVKESYEISVLTAYFDKAFKLENSDQNDEDEDCILYKVNYSHSVTKLILFLVLPVCTGDEIMVIPPNLTSCTAALLSPMCSYYMDETMKSLSSVAIKEIETICYGQPSSSVMCPCCQYAHDSQMVGNHSSDVASTEDCRCNVIQKYISKWRKFSCRMISILLWSELLSQVPPDIYQFESSVFRYRNMMAERFKSLKPAKSGRKKRRGRKRTKLQSCQTQASKIDLHQVHEDVPKKKRGRKPKQVPCDPQVNENDHFQVKDDHQPVSEDDDDDVMILSSD